VELSCRFCALATSVAVEALFIALLLLMRIAAASSRESVSGCAASCNGAIRGAASSHSAAILGKSLFIVPVFYGEIQSGRKIVEGGIVFVLHAGKLFHYE
jgi:hypothetical protein